MEWLQRLAATGVSPSVLFTPQKVLSRISGTKQPIHAFLLNPKILYKFNKILKKAVILIYSILLSYSVNWKFSRTFVLEKSKCKGCLPWSPGTGEAYTYTWWPCPRPTRDLACSGSAGGNIPCAKIGTRAQGTRSQVCRSGLCKPGSGTGLHVCMKEDSKALMGTLQTAQEGAPERTWSACEQRLRAGGLPGVSTHG